MADELMNMSRDDFYYKILCRFTEGEAFGLIGLMSNFGGEMLTEEQKRLAIGSLSDAGLPEECFDTDEKLKVIARKILARAVMLK